jgi:hypothetical protein
VSRHFEPSSLARQDLSIEDQVANEMRARQAGVYVLATRSIRRNCWRVAITGAGKSTVLFGSGPLQAVIDGAWDDFDALDEEDGPSPDINREGLAEFNGAFG